MYHLSACNRDLFKRYYCYLLVFPFKTSFKYYEKGFSFHLCIFLKKFSFLRNIRNECVFRKINLYFLTSWKTAKLFLQKLITFNIITDSFLVEKFGKFEHVRRYVCKNLLNLDYQESIRFGIFQISYGIFQVS